MNLKSLLEILFYGSLECLALSFVITVFLKQKIKLKILLSVGVIGSIVIHLLRMIPMTFGFHSFLYILFLTIVFKLLYKKKMLDTFINVLKTFFMLTLFEFLSLNVFHYFLGSNIKIWVNNSFLKLLLMLPQITLLFLVGLFLKKHNKEEKEGTYDLQKNSELSQ